MEILFHSHANKTHFHKKGCAPSLILKVRVFGTRKWPIVIHLTFNVSTLLLLNNQISHKVFSICFLFSFKVLLQLLCIPLVPLVFPYSA